MGTPATDTVTITDDELPTVTVSASDAVAGEPADDGEFTFTRTGPTTGSLTVLYSVSGSATADSDYTALTGTAIISTGQATATVAVSVLDDTETEAAETVTMTVTADPAYLVGVPATDTVTITDDDTPTVTVTATDSVAGEPADGGEFTFTRTGPTTGPLIVTYTTSGSATADTDYTALTGTVVTPLGKPPPPLR